MNLSRNWNWRLPVAMAAAVIGVGAVAGSQIPLVTQSAAVTPPPRVDFMSADRKTRIFGFVYRPAMAPGARVPAVVMMHGRQGPYSTLAKDVFDGSTLSKRHQFWGQFWAAHGYLAILVDSFGPRGYPRGFGRFTHDTRPKELNEVTVRPLDAYGTLAYLRSRPDVVVDRIALQGWSNGGSATLAAMATDAPGITQHTPAAGFRAALSFYPGCGLDGHFDATGYRTYAPLRVFMGTADEEVSPKRCQELLDHAAGDIKAHFYEGATHDFDDPGTRRQSVPANAAAYRDVVKRAPAFLAQEFSRTPKS
jgi:dienelactone hydrolase